MSTQRGASDNHYRNVDTVEGTRGAEAHIRAQLELALGEARSEGVVEAVTALKLATQRVYILAVATEAVRCHLPDTRVCGT